VELRGLAAGKKYKVMDYVNNKDYGVVTGPTAELPVEFPGHLLLQATPSQPLP
jgi:alpha-galactosidase